VKLFLQLIRMLFSVGWLFVRAVAEVSRFAQIRFATVVNNCPNHRVAPRLYR
jgi:hypothetical protein